MYGWLWRTCPLHWTFKTIIALSVLVLVVYVCFNYLFPPLNEWLLGNPELGG